MAAMTGPQDLATVEPLPHGRTARRLEWPLLPPALFLWGDRDRLCIPDGAEDLQAMLPHARIEMIPGCGHTPQIECPELVADTIEEFAR